MRISKFISFLFAFSLVVIFFVVASAQSADAGAKLLPDKIGDLRGEGKVVEDNTAGPGFKPEDYSITSAFTRRYRSPLGTAYSATVIQTVSNAAAYSILAMGAEDSESEVGPHKIDLGGAEAVSTIERDRVAFVKGSTFVSVTAVAKFAYTPGEQIPVSDEITSLARAVANSINADAGELPVLLLHLPDSEAARGHAAYAVSLPALQLQAGNRPALDALSFEGGAEAVLAKYGDAKLVLVEFSTPQYAADNDARIGERIAQLRAAGQPVPSAYKRVGNYSVFVFDAPDAAAADKLASGVKYEKDVRWLGRNPHAEEIATKAYTSTMGNVIITTLIATGLAILFCLGVGGTIGGAVFLYRRARHTAQEIYSDAGGMLRLNIEDLNAPRPPATKLIGRGEE